MTKQSQSGPEEQESSSSEEDTSSSTSTMETSGAAITGNLSVSSLESELTTLWYRTARLHDALRLKMKSLLDQEGAPTERQRFDFMMCVSLGPFVEQARDLLKQGKDEACQAKEVKERLGL